ncbi:hypothetical protein BJ912DRAFT_1067751 [Pholiota molesta]|nr:hypothetical protein BJ912DRAFT_1067751 [Pholiota molesta]
MLNLVQPDANPAEIQIQIDKQRFVHRMGPYYLQAYSEGTAQEAEFFQAVFRHHCDRWPVNAKDYPDLDFMKADLENQRKALIRLIKSWAGLGAFAADKHWSELFKRKVVSDTSDSLSKEARTFTVNQLSEVTKEANESDSVGGSMDNPIDVDLFASPGRSRMNPIKIDATPSKEKRGDNDANHGGKVNPRHINVFK